MGAIVFDPIKGFGPIKIRCSPEQLKNFNKNLTTNELQYGQTCCVRPVVVDDKYRNRFNNRFFTLELDKPFDKEFAIYFDLVSYKTGPTGEKIIF